MITIKKYLNLGNLFLNRGLPTYLVFHVTSACNSKCKMCFNWKNLNKNKQQKELSLKEINKFSKTLKNLIYVSLGGGEPFLRNDLSDIVDIFYRNNNTNIFQIATNCLQPKQIKKQTEQMLRKYKKAIIKITLSLDGIEKHHDNIRGVKGNFEKFKETYKLLSELRKKYRNLEILVNTVYSKYTNNKVKEIYEWVKKNMDVDLHSFTYVRGETKEIDAKDVFVKDYEKFIKYVDKEYRGKHFRSGVFKKIFPVLSILTRRYVLKELKNQKRIFKCFAGKRLLHIDSFGNSFACEYLPNKTLGNLRDYNYDVKKILKLNNTKQILNIIKHKKCSCTWECAIKQSIVYDWKNWPIILKELIKLKS